MKTFLKNTFLILLVALPTIAAGILIWTAGAAPKTCEVHSYLVVRINPAWDGLIRPTTLGGDNPKLILTDVLACGYRATIDNRTEFFFYKNGSLVVDTMTDVVHIKDEGVYGR